MFNRKRNTGFTLTEVLISAGILVVGFVLIAGAFPVGVKLTSQATERTIGSTAAQEAIAKMKIYGLIDTIPNLLAFPALYPDQCVDYESIAGPGFIPILPDLPFEQYYPSTNLVGATEKKYHWSALCRYTGPIPGPVPQPGTDTVQVTVFVSRLGGIGLQYPDPFSPASTINVPKPVNIPGVPAASNTIDLTTMPEYLTYFREGSVIVDDYDGNLYTVQKMDAASNTIVLNRSLVNPAGTYDFWVLPSAVKPGTGTTPPTIGGRWPCVWVSQHTIDF
ncbi:MAG: hypothetical protein FVQ82_01635 [Planctomycetes bacterium]|nr:hypothetical protein [Planctomycetota bacterium]